MEFLQHFYEMPWMLDKFGYEAISAGTWAVAAYNQELIVQLLKVDGKNEFIIYLAAVGKVG
jgi:hypothetical protein